jgi:putative ABC transport system permease protein
LAGTLAFSRFVIKDIFRNKGRTLSSIIGVVLAVSLIAGENIALDTTARDVLSQELEDYNYDLYGSSEEILTYEEMEELQDDTESVFGIKSALPMSYIGREFEIYNITTIVPPKYGYYETKLNISIPPNSTVELNATLDPIPHETYKLFGYIYSSHDGEPRQNFTVEVQELQEITWSGGYTNGTQTDDFGYYEISLPESEFEIKIKKGISTFLVDRIQIKSSEPEERLDFYILDVESSSIQGYIYDPSTGNPYIGSLWVDIRNDSIPHSNNTMINNGYYYMNTIPGNFTIFGWSYTGISTNYTQVEVYNNSIIWLNLTLWLVQESEAQLEGYVYDNLTGLPIRNVDVTVINLDNFFWFFSTTNFLGHFQMNISSGNSSVSLRKDGYLTYRSVILNLPGDKRSDVFILEPINSTIGGYVTSTSGEFISNAKVEVQGIDFDTTTDRNGYYSLGVPTGNYTIAYDARYRKSPYEHENIYMDIYSFLDLSGNKKTLEKIAPYELISGTIEIGDGNVVLTENLAKQYDLDIGERITLLLRGEETYTRTYNISGIVIWKETQQVSTGPFPDLLMGFSDLNSLISYIQESEFEFQTATELFIKMDRDKVIDPYARESTDIAIRKLTTRINSITVVKHDIVVNSMLEEPLESYYDWFERYRLQMLAYSLPVVAVGFYLGIVGIDLSLGQKRRVFGIIKSRGANEKQIYLSLLFEALILGVIAGGVGLVLGVFVSRIFLNVIPGSRDLAAGSDLLSFNISLGSIIIAMLFAIALMFFASIKPAKRISRIPVIESMHHHSEAADERYYRPTLDIFLVFFAVMAYIMVAEVNLAELDPARYGVVVTMLLIILYIISLFWLPFSPIILMFSLTRLLTRGTDKVYRFFSRAVKPFAGELWYVIHKNMSRNPKRVSMVSIIIALALGFGIFMTTMIATTMYGMELRERAMIGADLNVVTSKVNQSFENDLELIQGVEDVLPVTWINGKVLGGGEYLERSIILFSANEYLDQIEIYDYYFVEGSPNNALKAVGEGDAIIVGESIAQLYSIGVGSHVRIKEVHQANRPWNPSNDIELKNSIHTVAGIVRALPGLEITEDAMHYWGGGIYMDYNSLNTSVSDVEGKWRFLVNVEKGHDSKEVENAIYGNYSMSITEIKNLKSTLDNIRNDIPSNSVLYIMLINIGFMIIIITVGLALILFISIRERKNEFATMMARGAESKHISVLIVGEAFSITMVGAAVGVFAGLFTAYTFNKMLSSGSLFGQNMMSGRPLIIPWYGVLIIVLALLSLIFTSIIAAYMAKRIKLHQALRIRGG